MKNNTADWIKYADENLKSAELLFERELFNPCLQNCQQAAEKYLKSIFIEKSIKLRKTHSINELQQKIIKIGYNIDITEDECDLLDSIYLPSKYPLGSVLPQFEPDQDVCLKCLNIVRRISKTIKEILS